MVEISGRGNLDSSTSVLTILLVLQLFLGVSRIGTSPGGGNVCPGVGVGGGGGTAFFR